MLPEAVRPAALPPAPAPALPRAAVVATAEEPPPPSPVATPAVAAAVDEAPVTPAPLPREPPAPAAPGPAEAAPLAAAAARPPLPRPFTNVGNSCFVNASVQAAFGLRTWRAVLARMEARRARPANAARAPAPLWTEGGQVAELDEPGRLLYPRARPEDLLAATYHVAQVPPSHAPMLPASLLRRFYHGVQEDAGEFMLGSFLNLDEEVNPVLLPTLRGRLRTVLRCADCGTEREGAEGDSFGCLTLPLRTAAGQEIRSVEAALAEYRRAEPMPLDYLWHCPNPACHAAGVTKRMDFQTLPDVLWFQLQRWRMEAPGRPVRNLFHEVNLNEVVRLRAAGAPQTVRRYRLAGVVCHVGAVPQARHYVAKARHERVWYRYDDVRREEVRPGQPLAGAVEKAYLLAYEFDGEEAFGG
jgi:uncharacterized UBP type Zn finger protein